MENASPAEVRVVFIEGSTVTFHDVLDVEHQIADGHFKLSMEDAQGYQVYIWNVGSIEEFKISANKR